MAPASATIKAGTSIKLVVPDPNRVEFQVLEGSGGSVAGDGTYTSPTVAGTYHALSRLILDPTITATSVITVQP